MGGGERRLLMREERYERAGATEPDGWDLASTGEELTFAHKGKTDRTAATHTHQQC